jgi:hypothetical protein
MSRLPRIAAIDALAVLGLALLAVSIGIRIGPDVAAGVVGAAFLAYAILASRTEVIP